MKIVLTRDHEKLGNVGDVVEVKDGYARNFLIPKNIALIANKGNVKQVELIRKSLLKKEAKNIKEAEQIAERLEGLEILYKARVSPDGKLYGSITNKDIAEKILEERKVEIDKKKIQLDEHIKELGEYKIEIKLYKEIKSIIKVKVESEEEPGEDETKLDAEKEKEGQEESTTT